MALQELRGLKKFVSNVAESERASANGPLEPREFDVLLERLQQAEGKLPPPYARQL